MTRAAILVFCVLYTQAADKLPQFEVASIKPGAPGGQSCGSTLSSPLQFTVQNCTVSDLVRNAWSLRSYEFSAPPDPAWISSARYDVTAKSATPVNPGDHWHMLQSLLEDRFALKFHRETKQLPAYYLSASKAGLKLITAKSGVCVPFDHKSPPHPPRPDQPPYCDYISMPFTKDGLGLQIDGVELSMSSFVSPLVLLLGRPVIDQTGFTGIFDVHLKFAKDSIPALSANLGGPAQTDDPTGLPSIFTAIRGLGLNIVSGKGPVDVFVVDSVQRPSEN
jgi:uncharacterized protein (TIGR03435 family)